MNDLRMLITGSGGLVGSEAALYFARHGWQVFGVDNDTRSQLFGSNASVQWRIAQVKMRAGENYSHYDVDIADRGKAELMVHIAAPDVVIHTAAQPSHDWAAKDPHLDFSINALGTLNLLEATRQWNAKTPFLFTSTNKVYGDTPNSLPILEFPTRLSLPFYHKFAKGIDESMSIDDSTHSLFGVSKTSADLLVQEYGRYFDMPTVAFRCGCITGPSHQGAELHGFLSYLMKCVKHGDPYTVFGYGGKQVRDNIHATDLVRVFEQFISQPTRGQAYNIGGGVTGSCSVLEAIALAQETTGRELEYTISKQARIGDHKWWISSNKKFEDAFQTQVVNYSLREILEEIAAEPEFKNE